MENTAIRTETPLWLTHAAIMTTRLEESIAFYRDVLGLTLRRRVRGGGFLGVRARPAVRAGGGMPGAQKAACCRAR